MIEEVIPLQLDISSLIGHILGFLVFCYALFSILVIRQIHILVTQVKTSISSWVYALGLVNCIFALLAFFAALALLL